MRKRFKFAELPSKGAKANLEAGAAAEHRGAALRLVSSGALTRLS